MEKESGEGRDIPSLRNDNIVEWRSFATKARETDFEDHGSGLVGGMESVVLL